MQYRINIFILMFFFTFSFTQNMGILKTKKNKLGVGIFVTTFYSYKGQNDGADVWGKPERYIYQLNYTTPSDFEFYINVVPGEIRFYNSNNNEKYYDYNIGLTYHFQQRKWGSSLTYQKNKWYCDTENILLNDYIDDTGKTSFIITIYSKQKYHPFVAYSNSFEDDNDDNGNHEEQLILHWGLNLLINDQCEINKDDANFYIGIGYAFF